MNTAMGMTMIDEPLLGFWDKLASYTAWVLAGALFFTVGWIALEPVDPLGPISLMTGHGVARMLVQASLLAMVAAFIGTVIIGRKLPDAGTFAAALGLAVVSVRGGTMELLLLKAADAGTSDRALASRLAVEAVGWCLVIVVALVTSAFVSRWLHRSIPEAPTLLDDAPHGTPAGWDVPVFGALLGRPPSGGGTAPATGARHVVISAGMMLVAYQVFGTGLDDRVITHGQACFVVAASACAGGYVAYRFAPVQSALWPVLAVFVFAVASYVIASFTSVPPEAGSALPANIPTSRFLRALPVQVVAVGTAAAIATFWWRRAVGYLLELMMRH